MSRKVMIMAGGTGGHVFPGLAVAEMLRAKGWSVVWMGNPDGMEARLVPSRGFEMAWVNFSALRGKGWLRKFMLPFNLLRGFIQAGHHIRFHRPDLVIGFGGYITFPGGMMASLSNVPLLLHEQNAVPGLANKVLSRLADRVLTGFPETFENGEWIGNPVREEICKVVPPRFRFVGRTGPLHILVFGGSLGATALNEVVPKAMAMIPAEHRPQVVHQAGERHLESLLQAYESSGVTAHCVPFIDDMAGAYEWADLVICRSGALTVSELAASGAASLLVPFPLAVDDHQTCNARFLSGQGAAWLIPQSDLDPEKLAKLCLTSREVLHEMAEKAHGLARAEATAEFVAVCEAMVNSTHAGDNV